MKYFTALLHGTNISDPVEIDDADTQAAAEKRANERFRLERTATTANQAPTGIVVLDQGGNEISRFPFDNLK